MPAGGAWLWDGGVEMGSVLGLWMGINGLLLLLDTVVVVWIVVLWDPVGTTVLSSGVVVVGVRVTIPGEVLVWLDGVSVVSGVVIWIVSSILGWVHIDVLLADLDGRDGGDSKSAGKVFHSYNKIIKIIIAF